MTTYNDVFGALMVPDSETGYAEYSLSGDAQFYWPELTASPYLVNNIMELTASLPVSMTLPPANSASVGRGTLIRNVGSFVVTLLDFAGVALATMSPGEAKYVYLKDNSTPAGIWSVLTFGTGTSAADAGMLAGYGMEATGPTLSQVSPIISVSGDASLGISGLAQTVVFSGSGSVSLALLATADAGNGFFASVSNQGTGTVNITPDGTELIDGEATKALVPGESLTVVSNGFSWVSIGYGRSTQFQFTKLVFDITTGSPFTLTSAQASNKIIQFIGTASSNIVVNFPNVVAIYYVQNSYAGAFTLTAKTASGTGIILSNTDLIILYCDGTNVVAAQSVSAPASNLSGGSAGVMPYQTGPSTTGFTSSGTSGQVLNAHGSVAPTWNDLGIISHSYASKSNLASSDELLVSDSASSYGAAKTTVASIRSASASDGLRNRVINGAMQVDQRNSGAVQVITAASTLAYTADMFYAACTGASITGQRITQADGKNRYRLTGLAGNTTTIFGTRVEAAYSLDMAGLPIVLQAKLSSTSITTLSWALYYANTVDTFGTLAAPTRTLISGGSFTISPTEGTFSAVLTLPSAAITGLELVFSSGPLLGSQTLTFGDIQIAQELSPSPFERRPQVEFSLCQRYYQRHPSITGEGYNLAAANTYSGHLLPVQMRVAPTGTVISVVSNFNTLTASASTTEDQVQLTTRPISTGYAFSILDLALSAVL